MQLAIKNGVVWDTEKEEQTPAAIQWMMGTVMPNMREPKQLDSYGRPVYWDAVVDGWRVRVTYIYVHANAASLKKERTEITITNA